MASGCLSLFFADEILRCIEAMKDDQLISPAVKDELEILKNVVSSVRAGFLYAEGRQRKKGLKASAWKGGIRDLENYLCSAVNELFFWVREIRREKPKQKLRKLSCTTITDLFLNSSPSQAMKRFQMEIKGGREELERFGRKVFDGFDIFLDRIKSGEDILDWIKSGEAIRIDSFGDDSEEESYGENKDETIQSLIPPFVRYYWQEKLLESIGRRLLFQNDVAINTLRNIFYFKYSSLYYPGSAEKDYSKKKTKKNKKKQKNKKNKKKIPERVIKDPSTKLMQSYVDLPLRSKYCFDYCSLFPRDNEIEVEVLVKLWMAQGFIIHSDEDADEDVGRRCFEELLERGFFEQVESDELDQKKVTKCRMDSHASAVSTITSGSRYLLLRSDVTSYIDDAFHLSLDFHLYSVQQILSHSRRRPSSLIRSFLLPCQLKSKYDRGIIDPKKILYIISPHDSRIESVSDLVVSELDALRALELHDLAIQSLPDDIDRLKHLRYLDVSRNPDIKLLPNSITNLLNLQTLKLSSCIELRELPKDMKNLIHLRHLEIEGCFNLRYMPPHLAQLTNLQTLSQFVLNDDVHSADDHTYCSQLKELGRLNSLRRELKIKNLSSLLAKDGACKVAALGEKKHLQYLTLDWGVGEGTSDQYQSQLEDLEPDRNLKGLSLTGYGGAYLPSWPLPGNHVHLVKLALRRCHKLKVVLNEKLPSLKSLVLDDMADLEYLSVDYLQELFPSLQELWLTELPKLKGWWEKEDHEKPSFRCLSKLYIQDCPKLGRMPFFPTLDEELVLDTTSFITFQQTMALEETQQCHWLTCPPLSKLKNLSLVGIDELEDSIADEIPWEALTSLCVMKFDCLTNLEELPSKLQHLTNLKELHIWRCKMTALPWWIKDMKSLEKLAIWVCPHLESLPEGIDNLTSLKTLEIEDCPILLQRCQKKTGADWEKIKHIPHLLGQLSEVNRANQ